MPLIIGPSVGEGWQAVGGPRLRQGYGEVSL
jgi:hypothetical protein